MSPLDRLPENALPNELKLRTRDLEELKGSFQAFGSTSVVTHRVFSPDTYDIQFTASSTPGTLIVHRADVEFIPDDTTLGGAFAYMARAKYLDTSNVTATYYFPWVERVPTTDGTQKWRFYHASFGYPADTVRLKFYFFTTGSGTFTANVIS
jgi:hypothetical protein